MQPDHGENMERELYFVNLNEKWQNRFRFFHRYGTNPSAPEYRAAIKALPARQRILVNANFFAFFFGLFYLLFLGLWRKCLSLFGLIVISAIIVTIIEILLGVREGAFNLPFSLAWSFVCSMIANRAYYLHVVKKSTSWNPFEK